MPQRCRQLFKQTVGMKRDLEQVQKKGMFLSFFVIPFVDWLSYKLHPTLTIRCHIGPFIFMDTSSEVAIAFSRSTRIIQDAVRWSNDHAIYVLGFEAAYRRVWGLEVGTWQGQPVMQITPPVLVVTLDTPRWADNLWIQSEVEAKISSCYVMLWIWVRLVILTVTDGILWAITVAGGSKVYSMLSNFVLQTFL